MSSPSKLTGRIALITGASRGIGRAIARRFADEGAHVVCVARSQGALETLDDELRAKGQGATLVPADLRDGDLIDLMAESVAARWGRLDVLVGNAGLLGTMGPLAQGIQPGEWNDVLAVNVTANWRLIRAFDSLLKASDAGRAIFVSSGAAAGPRAYWGPYAVSKAALEMLARTYAAEVAKTNVRVNVVDPGRTRTGMRAKAYPGENPEGVKPPEDLGDLFVELASKGCARNGEVVRYAG